MGILILFLYFAGILSFAQGIPQLLFANRKDIRLVNVTGGKPNVTVIVGNLDDAAAVDFMYSEGYIFWTDINIEVIQRAVINRTQQTRTGIITTGLVSPDGLACDWIGKKLYWTDAETNRIEVSNVDGSYRKVLYWEDLDQPRAIALDPFRGYMYWTDWGEVPKIERAGMDGSLSTRTVIVDENIYWPNGLTIDYDDEKIFWADAKNSYIHSCNFDGTHRKVIIDTDLPHPFALTLYRDSLYWTDWQTKAIHTCDKRTGIEGKIILMDIHSPMDIHVFDANRQPEGENPCGSNNGGCSHLCLMSPIPPRYKCACPTGVRLLSDQKTCADGVEEMLLLARRTDLRRISLDTPDFTDVVLQLDNIKHSIAIDYDPVEGYVYWTDDEVRAIRRAFLNGTGQVVLVDTEVDHPDGIAVDWIGRNLYWTDTGTDRIEVARLNGTSRKILISENLDEPRALCLDPERGTMWWTDWGASPKIETAYLDGTNRKTVIDRDLGWPNGIVVDYADNKIYWCDAKLDKIEVANMNGTGRRVLVKDNLPHLFGFSLLGDYLYWTEWQRRSVERVNKRTGGNRTLIIDQLPDLMGLKAVKVKKSEGTNDCENNNGWCSHLCLYTPKGAQCACPMGLELISKGKKCIVPEAFLLFTREQDIKRVSLSESHRVVPIPLKDIKEAMSIDFDIGDNRIYWTDGGDLKSISRAFMNGSSIEKIIDFGIKGPEGMAVDWVARNIYWADSKTHRIEVARLNGASRRVLVWEGLIHPKAIALDPPNGYMYWVEWSQPPKLERAWLDGTNREILPIQFGRVYGLTIDYIDKRLYWTDFDNKCIESANMLGEDRKKIVQSDIEKPMALTQYQDYLYWTNMEKKTIEKANKTTGNNRTIVLEYVDGVMDLLIFHGSRQSGWNSCLGNNGKCSHLCLALPDAVNNTDRHKCACPTHHTLDSDNRTCSPPKSFILFSQKTEISRLIIGDGKPDTAPDIVLPIQNLNRLKAIDYDQLKGYIYWISGKSKSIKRAKVDGSEPEKNVINLPGIRPFDLAIDPYSRVLFYSCSLNNVINFTHIDSETRGTVVKGNFEPRYLALNPEKGYLFWTSNNVITRTLFDGTEHLDIFESKLSKLGPITVDPETNMLFWVDLEDQVIECGDFHGGNRKQLFSGKADNNIQTVVGLAVFRDYLYWVDNDKKLIGRVNKRTGEELKFVQGRVPNLSDIHAVIHLEPLDVLKHPCGKDNGNCSHLCFTKESEKAQCSCPSNLVLRDDERSCAEKTTCSPDQFTCKTGNEDCIPKQWYCDGSPDCGDKSDEEDCPVCDIGKHMCKDRKCILESQVCDGKFQCSTKEDEDGCCEKESQIKCADGSKCYEKTNRCDGKYDCGDHSDEESCPDIVGETTTQSLSAHVIVAIVVGVFFIIVVIAVVFACRRKTPDAHYDDHVMIALTKHSNSSETPNNTLGKRSKKHERKPLIMTTLSLGSESANVYDRSHVTGASSSSSAVTQYPKETLNPPPSPVTDRSVCAENFFDYTTNSPSTIRSFKHKHRRRHVPPPPTTPCSTDVCEDSEPYFRNKYFNNSRVNNSRMELNYDSDPYPPPPTPRSHYFSDIDVTSCPDSPTTERSYFNPYPPPPSPVANSDC